MMYTRALYTLWVSILWQCVVYILAEETPLSTGWNVNNCWHNNDSEHIIPSCAHDRTISGFGQHNVVSITGNSFFLSQ